MTSEILRLAAVAFSDDPVISAGLLAAAADDERPEVRVAVSPGAIERGQLLEIQALFVDKDRKKPVAQPGIYLLIMDAAGKIVYPASLMARGRSGLAIRISTSPFEPGGYRLMVGNSRNFSPSTAVSFTVYGRLLPEDLQPLLLEPIKPSDKPVVTNALVNAVTQTLLGLAGTQAGRPTIPIVPLIEDDRATIKLRSSTVRFVTELDRRVCPICAAFDGEVYTVDPDTGIIDGPTIPVHPNCRCHYEYVDAPL